jgi:predicted RNA-binding Zn ribbon-like protein
MTTPALKAKARELVECLRDHVCIDKHTEDRCLLCEAEPFVEAFASEAPSPRSRVRSGIATEANRQRLIRLVEDEWRRLIGAQQGGDTNTTDVLSEVARYLRRAPAPTPERMTPGELEKEALQRICNLLSIHTQSNEAEAIAEELVAAFERGLHLPQPSPTG